MTSASPPVPIHANEPPLATLRLALWFGLLTGIGEVVLIAARKYVLHHLVFFGNEVVWMAPLADAILFVVAGIALIGLRAVLPGRLRPPAVLVFAALAAFTLLLMYGPLYRSAAAVLAIGIGTAAFRMARRWTPAFDRTVRWTLPIMVFGVVAAGAVRVYAAGNQGSEPPSAVTARSDAPDILFIVLDTVRAWNLSVYGYPRPTTPEIERWMRDGVRFEHVLSTAPWTLASHATMFTGRYPHELSADWLTALDATYPTLAEVLSARGYAAAGFVANMSYCSYETGLARGFSHYEDYPISAAHVMRSSSLGRLLSGTHSLRNKLQRKSAETINAEFLGWLNGRQDARPYFVFLNYLDAHEPYQPPAAFDHLYSTPGDAALIRDLNDGSASPKLTPEARRAAIGEYDESITYLDYELGRLFTELKRRGRWDRTLVVITADHGEEFGERGLYFHGNSLYRASLEVPLLLRLPGVVPASRSIGAQCRSKTSLPRCSLCRVDDPNCRAVASLATGRPGRRIGGSQRRAADGAQLLSAPSEGCPDCKGVDEGGPAEQHEVDPQRRRQRGAVRLHERPHG